MKKTLILFSLLLLITIAIFGCASSESNAEKVAEDFTRNLYTVDAAKIADYEDFHKEAESLALNNDNSLVQVPDDIFKAFDKNLLPLMTEKAYETLVANRFNALSASICYKGGYTLQVTKLSLEEKKLEDNDRSGYYYEATLKFISNDGKTEKTDTSKGYIELIKEEGKWKVVGYQSMTQPQLYKEIIND